jgi:hypothetical protein
VQRGDVVGDRFEILARRGAGGMGEVFRARDLEAGGDVAVKVLRGPGADRFGREAEALTSLFHPAIVRFVARGTTADGAPFLAMEWLEGEDLDERLGRGPLDVAQARVLAGRVASALAAAHARGVVHRDVKPANVFLPGGDVGAAKVLDFGIARLTDLGPATATGTVLGTLGYMAPEQARGERDVDPRCDLFSLGCVLFECLAGRPAFHGEHAVAVLAKVLIESPPRLADLGVALPAALDDLVARLLAKSPDDRPASAAAVLEELGRIDASPASTAPPAPRGLTDDEVEVVSVALVAADEGAEHAQTVASEDWHALRTGLSRAVAASGGRIDPLLGGTFVATVASLGTPRDRARSVARMALAMRAAAPHLPMAVATGRGASGASRPVGEVLDRAASRLRAIARAGDPEIALDDLTADLVDGDFAVARRGGGAVLVGDRRVETDRPARAACFGRDRELATIAALYDECADEPSARAALLVGVAGAGKTRLVAEAVARARAARDATVWAANAEPLGHGSPYALVARLVRAAAGVRGDEGPEAQLAKITDLAARHAGPGAPRVGAALAATCGLAARPEGGEPEREAFEALLAGASRARPLLLVLEDLHWADRPSARLVDGALRRLADAPIFVLGTARPEVATALPGLWAGRSVDEIRVGELGRRAAERVVRARLGDAASKATVDAILERAAGNALFLEELARAVAAGRREGLPDTVAGVIEARLRTLDPESRRLLRAASVLGRTFFASGAAALLGPGATREATRARLDELCDREVLALADAALDGDALYAFPHALVRDAAYAMLTDEDRALGHRLAADWLEHRGAVDPLEIALHCDRAGAAERAIGWLERAAADVLAAGELSEALDHVRRALELGAEGPARGRLAALAADALFQLGDLGAAQAQAKEALALLPQGTPEWYRASRAAMAFAISRLGRF